MVGNSNVRLRPKLAFGARHPTLVRSAVRLRNSSESPPQNVEFARYPIRIREARSLRGWKWTHVM
jgi:hypothetical protein